MEKRSSKEILYQALKNSVLKHCCLFGVIKLPKNRDARIWSPFLTVVLHNFIYSVSLMSLLSSSINLLVSCDILMLEQIYPYAYVCLNKRGTFTARFCLHWCTNYYWENTPLETVHLLSMHLKLKRTEKTLKSKEKQIPFIQIYSLNYRMNSIN